ncbi:MAG: hypothetical protein ACRD2H_09625 [Terriglobales bacterium]
MSTVRNIERRTFARRQVDREWQDARSVTTTAAAPERGIQWNGVWNGYMMWIGSEAILLALVLGFGMGNRNPLHAASWSASGKATMVWAIIVTWIATFIGGWVAGRTPPTTVKRHGVAKALALWGLVELTAIVAISLVAVTSAAPVGMVGGHSVAWNFFWLSLIALGCAIGGGAVGGGGRFSVKVPRPAHTS